VSSSETQPDVDGRDKPGPFLAANAISWLKGAPAGGWRFTRPVEFAYERDILDQMCESL
jgi:hypothetical protein